MAGVSELRPRQGVESLRVYEPGRPLEEVAREHGLDPAELVKLASNENNLGPSPKAIEAMREAAACMHLYPDGGAFYLRRALSEKLEVSSDRFIFGNGSNELIELLGHVFLEPGTNIVMSECAFVIYRLMASARGAETLAAPMREFTHDLDAMAERVNDQTRLVFVANPNNPTGTRVENGRLRAFLDALPPHVLPVLDEAYVELLAEADQPASLDWLRTGRPLILLRTFSKTYGLAGVRLGYGVSCPEVISLLEKFRQPFNVNAMAQAAALAALEDHDHVRQTREQVRSGRLYFEKAFAGMGLETVPSCANFLLVKTGDSRGTFQALQRKGVIARPMDGYGLPDWLRISVGTHEENLQAVERLQEILA